LRLKTKVLARKVLAIELSDSYTEKIICNRDSCVHYRAGCCTLKNPERNDDYYLHYEDALSSLRLTVDPLKGTLRR
jgi:hypothetical protein